MLRKIWEKYYSQCNGVVFVIDGANEHRLDEARQILEKLYSSRLPTELVGLPVLFLVNKADSASFMGGDSIREHLGLGSLNCNSLIEVMECSASAQ